MSLRVIAGSAKGRHLKAVPGDTTRPVMDRVKEACFSILGRDILDATFLDLFAGTGSVGIEALSRGAQLALFVELEKRAIQTIQTNLQITGLGEKAIIRRSDVLSFLKHPTGQRFEFIYIAPPQYKGVWLDTLTTLDAHPQWLHSQTTVIVQIDPSEQQAVNLQNLMPYDERHYGKTLLWFFAPPEDEE
jgi:16S rRNA (guanine(966)-N(2))-methyltransferase RsmD